MAPTSYDYENEKCCKREKTRESTDSRTIVSIKERENTVKYKQHLCSSNMIFWLQHKLNYL